MARVCAQDRNSMQGGRGLTCKEGGYILAELDASRGSGHAGCNMKTPKSSILTKDVKQIVAAVAKLDIEGAIRDRGLIGMTGAPEFVNYTGGLVALFRRLAPLDLGWLPDKDLQSIRDAGTRTMDLWKELDSVRSGGRKDPVRMDSLGSKAHLHYEAGASSIIGSIALLQAVAFDSESWLREVKKGCSAAQEKAERAAHAASQSIGQVVEDINNAKRKVADADLVVADAKFALNEAKRLAGRAGSWDGSRVFEEAAAKCTQAARLWLACTVGVGLIAALISVQFLGKLEAGDLYHLSGFDGVGPPPLVPPTPGLILLYGVSKLGLISFAVFAAVWCGRNYLANKHSEQINLHRMHALETYEAFVVGAKSPDIQDAILQYSAQTVFLGRSTGFERHPEGGLSLQAIVDGATRAGVKEASGQS